MKNTSKMLKLLIRKMRAYSIFSVNIQKSEIDNYTVPGWLRQKLRTLKTMDVRKHGIDALKRQSQKLQSEDNFSQTVNEMSVMSESDEDDNDKQTENLFLTAKSFME